uniref:Uncharacterized protein n=1 Tax=Anguilla anguilla TaxID=7936 RepID=A0A0E9TBJ4_ANGAN
MLGPECAKCVLSVC